MPISFMRWSWQTCERQVASLPEPGPGPVTTTRGFVVSILGFAP
jgi:hypothetical protein